MLVAGRSFGVAQDRLVGSHNRPVWPTSSRTTSQGDPLWFAAHMVNARPGKTVQLGPACARIGPSIARVKGRGDGDGTRRATSGRLACGAGFHAACCPWMGCGRATRPAVGDRGRWPERRWEVDARGEAGERGAGRGGGSHRRYRLASRFLRLERSAHRRGAPARAGGGLGPLPTAGLGEDGTPRSGRGARFC